LALIHKVGFVGLGSHGCPMAVNILHAGFDVMVWDARPAALKELEQAGAKVAGSPEEVGRFAELIGVCEVADPEWDEAQIEAIVAGERGLLSGAKPGAIIAFHSAVYPSTVKRIAQQAETCRAHVVDAQVNGGEGRARARTLTYMLGGDERLLEQCRPVFAASGTTMIHVGPLGAGAAAKVAHYILVCASLVSVSEVMRMVEAAGVDLAAFQKVVHESAGQSWACDNWLQDFNPVPAERAEHLYRRIGYALGLASELGFALPAAGLAHQLMRSL